MRELTRSLLFADLSGFTALTEAHGDIDSATLAGRFTEMARASLTTGAELVKTIGDAVMIAAEEPTTALAIVDALYRAAEGEPRFPLIRAGLHEGSCVEREGDYFGGTVNLAARMAGHARAGQILCTAGIAAHAVRVGFESVSIGQARFKNVSKPVPVWELILLGRSVPSGLVDPVCRMRIEPSSALARLHHDGTDYYFCSLACAASFASGPEDYLPR